jgi:hypothetical protein
MKKTLLTLAVAVLFAGYAYACYKHNWGAWCPQISCVVHTPTGQNLTAYCTDKNTFITAVVFPAGYNRTKSAPYTCSCTASQKGSDGGVYTCEASLYIPNTVDDNTSGSCTGGSKGTGAYCN